MIFIPRRYDIQSTYRELKEKGVEFVSTPEQQEWGGWLVDFKDTTGNTLTFVQNGPKGQSHVSLGQRPRLLISLSESPKVGVPNPQRL